MKRPNQGRDFERSILSTIEFLQAVKKTPELFLYMENLEFHLKSQGGLCLLEIPDKGIMRCSLNTFKLHCSQEAPGGFEAVDKLRIETLQSLNNARSQSVHKKRLTQKQEIIKLTSDCDALNIDLLRLTLLLRMSMQQTSYYARLNNESATLALFEKERRELVDMMSTVGKISGTAI